MILFPGKHLTMSGDLFNVTTGVGVLPLAPAGRGSSRRRCIGWLLTTPKDYLAPKDNVNSAAIKTPPRDARGHLVPLPALLVLQC